jgi:hypothetical protein
MTMMTRLRAQDGYAVATAMIVMTLMLTIGVAATLYVNAETNSSRRERVQESRLNLTEGVVSAQIFQLSRNWPATADYAYPAACTQTSSQRFCPTPAQLKRQFKGKDVTAGAATWNVQVRDDDVSSATAAYYSDAAVLARPTWDQNGNGEMWVRAEGSLDPNTQDGKAGATRLVVARVRVEQKPLNFPDAPFVAGSFATGNSGNKIIVQTGGKNGIVRCDNGTAAPSYRDNACIGYDTGQVSPVGTVISDPDVPPNLIPPGVLDSLRAMAQAKGTYYSSGCPANPSGDIVFVETGNCIYNSNMTVNTSAKPGLFIVNNGTIKVNGTVNWYGVIYAVNAQNSTDTVVELSGDSDVQGGVFVDGPGRFSVGNSKMNLTYAQRIIAAPTAYGTAGIIQNTWREITPN